MPPPNGHWRFDSSRLRDGQLLALTGPNLMVSGLPAARDTGLFLDGPSDSFTFPWYAPRRWPERPSATVAVDLAVHPARRDRTMGLVGHFFVAEDGPRGWALTLEAGQVVFRVATPRGQAEVRGALPENDRAVLTAAYDGESIRLWIDDAPAGEAAAHLGAFETPGRAPFSVGGWWQGDRTLAFRGVVESLLVWDTAPIDRTGLPDLRSAATPPPPEPVPTQEGLILAPTIQQVSTDSATIVWESAAPNRGRVRFGANGVLERDAFGPLARIHKVRLTGLSPATTYSFEVPGAEASSFRTLPPDGAPLRFATVGDTQDHPEINAKVAAGMRAHDPDFALIVGDLVSHGWEKREWVEEFFGSMHGLFATVPLFPALGNHDRNARLYFDHLALPRPHYRYTFTAGAAQFFVLDTEREVGPGSAQHRWLARELAASTARWKIVVHHYPPYSSDLDDYGDDLGDARIRALVPLYDRHRVDLVLSGHIHSYERTHPLVAGKPTAGGTAYVVAGGGGGDLEQFLPEKPDFSAVRYSGHHYCIVTLDATTLRLDTYDLSGALLDSFTLEK